jgi:hypothetical protein
VHHVQLACVRSQGGRRLALNRSMWTPVHAPPGVDGRPFRIKQTVKGWSREVKTHLPNPWAA